MSNGGDFKDVYERLASHDSTLSRIDTTLDLMVNTMEKLVEKVDAPNETKWAPIIAALTLVLFMASGYTTLAMSPVSAFIHVAEERYQAQIDYNMGLERELGRIQGLIEGAKQESSR